MSATTCYSARVCRVGTRFNAQPTTRNGILGPHTPFFYGNSDKRWRYAGEVRAGQEHSPWEEGMPAHTSAVEVEERGSPAKAATAAAWRS